ncbi:MAG TPA: methyl-accepting chemotaxis protein [Candidatus Omnitrophota bacterium]|nr:methyl-accepting chemotaxis protein [Candidatus Omnitrophota bacterium]HPS36655.1 methyl-accepting chemotaxis protein [Candidatus Omnitrophota bacterium]
MKMTIGKKLTVGFGGTLVLMFAATLFCAVAYLKTVKDYATFAEKRVEQVNLVGDLTVEFKKQAQAWKNLLLRGTDPVKFAQYKDEFEKADQGICRRIEELKEGSLRFVSESNRQGLVEFEKGYKNLQEKYAAALKIYTSGMGGNLREADATVIGVDKAPTELLDVVADRAVQLTEQMLKEHASQAYGVGITISIVNFLVFLIGVLFTLMVIRSITNPLKSLMAVTGMVANSDLSQEVNVNSNDEIGELAASFKGMVAGLKGTLIKVKEATNHITLASNEILAASQEQASAAREQSSAVAETTSAAKELSTTSEQVGESIKKVAQVAAHALAGTAKIKESISKTNDMLAALGEKSQKIGKITEMIDDVADQTNLLAVNASIEAARAGEQGRGFTVVADEIRKLADSTAKSTKDITALIELIQHEMSNAIMSMESSVQNVDEEARLAQQTTEKTKEIAMSTHQQISGSKQIADAMMSIDGAMKQIAAGASQSQASVKQLNELAGELKQLASKFKL